MRYKKKERAVLLHVSLCLHEEIGGGLGDALGIDSKIQSSEEVTVNMY